MEEAIKEEFWRRLAPTTSSTKHPPGSRNRTNHHIIAAFTCYERTRSSAIGKPLGDKNLCNAVFGMSTERPLICPNTPLSQQNDRGCSLAIRMRSSDVNATLHTAASHVEESNAAKPTPSD